MSTTPVLSGKGLYKSFGRVVGLNYADFELLPGEVLAVMSSQRG